MQTHSETDFNTLATLLDNNLKAAAQAELNSIFQAEWIQVSSRGRQLREIANQLAKPELTERFQQLQQRATQVKAEAASFVYPDPCLGCSLPVYPGEVAKCAKCSQPINLYACGNCRESFQDIPPCSNCSP